MVRVPRDADSQGYPYRFTYAAKGSREAKSAGIGDLAARAAPPSGALLAAARTRVGVDIGSMAGRVPPVRPPLGEAVRAVAPRVLVEVVLVGPPPSERRVEGLVVSEYGAPATGAVVRLYHRGFGGGETKLGEVTTNAEGTYVLPYTTAGTANIELRSVDPQGNEVLLSKTRFGAEEHEVLNVVAPVRAVPTSAEFVRLRADIAKEVPDPKAFAAAVEDDDRQDITSLTAATGWDTRLVSLAAVAEQQSSATGLAADHLYGAFRVGLPTDMGQLALLGGDTFAKALMAARDAGVVALDDGQLEQAKEKYEAFARSTRREPRAPGALSTVGELLTRSGLTDNERNTFEDVYFTRGAGKGDLWQAAREKGLPEAKVNSLRLQGKLASLTLNNGALVDFASWRGVLAGEAERTR